MVKGPTRQRMSEYVVISPLKLCSIIIVILIPPPKYPPATPNAHERRSTSKRTKHHDGRVRTKDGRKGLLIMGLSQKIIPLESITKIKTSSKA